MRAGAWCGTISSRSPARHWMALSAGARRSSSQVDSPWLPGFRHSRRASDQTSKAGASQAAGHLGQAFLPLAQGRGVAIIDLHRGEQAPRALPLQPALHAPGEAAELLVLAISQGQQGVAQAIEAGGLAKHLAFEAAGAVRRLTVAEGADHEQRLARLGELPGIQARQRFDPHRQPGRLQLAGALPGQLLGKTALAGVADQPGLAAGAGAAAQVGAARPYRAFLAPAVEVEQPAGDEEQRHRQAGEHHQDASGHAEIAAYVQCIDAGQQLAAERTVAIALVAFHLAVGRVQGQGVEGTLVRRVGQAIEHCRRLAARRRQAQVVGLQAVAAGLADAVPYRRVVDHQRSRIGRALATSARLAALRLLAGGRVIEQFEQAVAVPLVGPVQAGQRSQQVERQAPGAGHGMQVPVETAPLARPVEGQPGAPVENLARPAQVETGQAEEDQDQGAGGGDLLAVLAHGEETVQLHHQVEETLPARLADESPGVGIDPARLAAALSRRRGVEDPPSLVAVHLDPDEGHFPPRLGAFDTAHQFVQRQHALGALLHHQHVRVERAHQLVLERQGRSGDAHQRQHQAGADTEEPMQLEPDFLHRITFTAAARQQRDYADAKRRPDDTRTSAGNSI